MIGFLHICVAMKPLDGNFAKNALAHGVSGLNIDGCRVGYVTVDGGNLALNPHLRSHINGGNGGNILAHEDERRVVTPHDSGRFPANLIHDGSEEVVGLFPETKSIVRVSEDKDEPGATFSLGRTGTTPRGHNDSGSAARFFKQA